MLFGVLHKLAIGFAVVSVVNGVFMQETFSACLLEELKDLKTALLLREGVRLSSKDDQEESMRVSDPPEILMNFRAALLARALELGFPKKYHITEVPDLVASCMLRILDLDRSHRLTRREFVCAVAIQKLASPAEAPILFEMLCHGQPGLCGHSHHSATAVVKVDAMKWLYLIAARAEDLPISEGKKDQEDQEADQKGPGKGREKGGIRTLRRVWTETPAVFKRLKEEQEKKVEEMLKLQKSLKQVETRPQISQPSYVHTVLYEDAKRRENARREASEPVAKSGRPHDQEYIERLAQKAPAKEAEEVPGPKRAVNLSRLTQLANERRIWHDQREKQRQAKIKEEAQICEQAAIQLREDVARKSRMTMALRHWRQLLAQVVIVAAFAPGLNAQGDEEKGGVWQLLALAAGSSKAHLRLAEDHDDVLSIAGGASLSWKDRARITMAARLKLLVRFKQVEEHWGCALDELLEGMNPDVPRNLDKQPKSVQGLEPAAVALPAELAATQQCAPFEGADSFVRLESLRDAGPLEHAQPGPARPEPTPAKPRRANERHAHGTPPRRGLVQPSAVPQRPQQLAVIQCSGVHLFFFFPAISLNFLQISECSAFAKDADEPSSMTASEPSEDGEACKYSEALELHLQNSEANVRQKTVTFLGHLGEKAHPSHAAVVADRFQDSDPAIFAVTAVALARMGKPGAAALASQLDNGQPDIEQQVACEALGRMPNFKAAVKHLKSLTRRLQDQGNTRRAAAEAICRLTSLAAEEALELCPDLPHQLVWALRDPEVQIKATYDFLNHFYGFILSG
eukprot:s422_g8.t1